MSLNLRTLALCLFITQSFVSPVDACDCLTPSSVETRLELATVVFSGRVVETTTTHSDEWQKTYRFDVIQHFKGKEKRSRVIRHDGTNCAFDFQPGSSYLVFANGRHALEANICSGTRELVEAAEDVAELQRLLERSDRK